jgi:hypothetical protein
MKAMNDRRRSTTSPVATIGVLCATHFSLRMPSQTQQQGP